MANVPAGIKQANGAACPMAAAGSTAPRRNTIETVYDYESGCCTQGESSRGPRWSLVRGHQSQRIDDRAVASVDTDDECSGAGQRNGAFFRRSTWSCQTRGGSRLERPGPDSWPGPVEVGDRLRSLAAAAFNTDRVIDAVIDGLHRSCLSGSIDGTVSV